MNDEQFAIAKTIMTRVVMEKIPKAKRWSVSKEFKSWIDNLSKEHFQASSAKWATGMMALACAYQVFMWLRSRLHQGRT
jgi:hypothetical protein